MQSWIKKKYQKNQKYKHIVAASLLRYGSESWATMKNQGNRRSNVEMGFLMRIDGKTIMDKMRNINTIRANPKVKPITSTIKGNQLDGFDATQKRYTKN